MSDSPRPARAALDATGREVEGLFAALNDVIGDGLVSAYLHGSAALGGSQRRPPRHRSVLQRARDVYMGTTPQHRDDLFPRTRPFGDEAVHRIGDAASSDDR